LIINIGGEGDTLWSYIRHYEGNQKVRKRQLTEASFANLTIDGEGDAFQSFIKRKGTKPKMKSHYPRTKLSKFQLGSESNASQIAGKNCEIGDNIKAKDWRQHTANKYQSLSTLIISFFTTTPLAINCCSIICHSNSSIPVEGE
jgi:hypothetical protein